MLNIIKNFMRFCREQNRRNIAVKKYVINQQLIRFYEDLQETKGEYNAIPACCLAYQAMKEHIKTDADVNRFYKKLELARLV